MKKNIHLMYAIAFLQGMVFYGPIATLYRQAQGVSVSQITLIESVSLLLCLLLEIPWGIIADRIGYKRTMVFCCFLYFVSKIVFWQATGFWWFMLERVMLSAVIAGVSGVDASILYLSCADGKSQKAFGVYNSLQMVGLLLASIVFSRYIGENYRLSGALTVISYGLAAILSLFLTEVKKDASRKFAMRACGDIFKRTIKNRRLLLFLIAVAFLSESHQTITVFLSQVQYVRCGLSASAIGYVFIAVTLVGLCGAYSARFTKNTGAAKAGTLFFMAGGTACIALAFSQQAALSVGAILVLRAANSLFQPFQMAAQNDRIEADNRATALSINAMIIDSIGAGTNLVFGTLAERNFSASFLFGAALCAAGLTLFLISGPKQKKRCCGVCNFQRLRNG